MAPSEADAAALLKVAPGAEEARARHGGGEGVINGLYIYIHIILSYIYM